MLAEVDSNLTQAGIARGKENEIGLQIAFRILTHGPMDSQDYYNRVTDVKQANNLLASNIFSLDVDTDTITFQSKIVEVYMQERVKEQERKSWLNWLMKKD